MLALTAALRPDEAALGRRRLSSTRVEAAPCSLVYVPPGRFFHTARSPRGSNPTSPTRLPSKFVDAQGSAVDGYAAELETFFGAEAGAAFFFERKLRRAKRGRLRSDGGRTLSALDISSSGRRARS